MKYQELLKYVRSITIFIILSLLLSGCASKKGEVRGIFVDSDGEPLLETITVILEPLAEFDDGGVGWSFEYQLTDEYRQRLKEIVTNNGTFLFENVEPGPYWIQAELIGRPVHTSPAFEVHEGEVVGFDEIIVK